MTPKHKRRIARALHELFSRRGFISVGQLFEMAKADNSSNLLYRSLDVHRHIALSDVGQSKLTEITEILAEFGPWTDVAEFGDVYECVRRIIDQSLTSSSFPDCSDELIDSINVLIGKGVHLHRFAFAMIGVELPESVEQYSAGNVVLHSTLSTALESVNFDAFSFDVLQESNKGCSWLVVSETGTATKAKTLALRHAHHVMGSLAVIAGGAYSRGAGGFHLGIVDSAESAPGRSNWASWTEPKRQLALTINFRRGQRLKLSRDLFDRLGGERLCQKLFDLIKKKDKTGIEVALCRAVYWYGDAHREGDPTMQLIKYWSCVETFFTAASNDITESVSNGLATIIAFGPLEYSEQLNFADLKRKAKALYKLRSKALHKGIHDACMQRDADKLSQLVAWMIMNIVVLSDRGVLELVELVAHCDLSGRAGCDPPL